MTAENDIKGVWLPAVRAHTGTDVFTERLAEALEKRGIRTEITWLPQWAEFLPWLVSAPKPPSWASVVHINSWLHLRFIPRDLPAVVTVHSCVHDPALTPYKNSLRRLYHKYWIQRCEKRAIQRADAVTAVSDYVSAQDEKVFSRSDIVSIYNWVDSELFTAPPAREPHRPFRVLFVGNTKKHLKGADLLGRIMEQLGDGYELWFTGEAGDLEVGPKNSVALGYLRSAQALVEAYTNCDVLLSPSRLEGFGLVALEAQSCGLPVVATNCSALPEVVMDGVTGLLCPRDDVGEFVSAIRKIQSDQLLWASMASAARNRAKDFFSEELAVGRYISIYRGLAAKGL